MHNVCAVLAFLACLIYDAILEIPDHRLQIADANS